MSAVSARGDVTLQTYEAAAHRYREQTAAASAAIVAWLAALAERAGAGARVLELGSGPGHDAALLERHGLHVDRTDATAAFVAMLRADGHAARLLDARRDDFGGPYDVVLADAVLLHLSRSECAHALRRARAAVRDGGLLAVTVKEGDGEAWSTAKLGQPRHFTYWREPDLRAVLAATAWDPIAVEHVTGREPWLYVVAGTA